MAAEPNLSPERSGAVGGESVALATPSMIGDFIGTRARLVFRAPGSATATARQAIIPLVARGAFKIGENESPRPQDRVFFNYNFFNNVGAADGIPGTDIHRETIGFEKTFCCGDASIGLRVPFIQANGGDGSLKDTDFGDLTVILKYAVINDRETGNVLSGGLAVTAPTGDDSAFDFNGTIIHSTLLQPWGGFICHMDDFFVQGFSSLIIPTDSEDVTIWFNDIGLGYMLYRSHCDQLVTSVVPMIEGHVTTPLNHRNVNVDLISIPDIVVLTGGVNFGLGHCSNLLLGVATPITGPRPFDVEAMIQLNFRF